MPLPPNVPRRQAAEGKLVSSPALESPGKPITGYVVALVVATVVVLLALLLVWAVPVLRFKSTTVTKGGDRCCRHEVEALQHQMNFSVSPCVTLYRHVCDDYGNAKELPAFKAFRSFSEREFYYKTPFTKAGTALYKFYQSCITGSANAHSLGARTAATYIEVLQLGPAQVWTKRDLLALLLKMTVKFQIWSYPILAVYGRGGFPTGYYFIGMTNMGEYLAIILRERARARVQTKIEDRYALLRRDCLQSINHLLSLNVTIEEMDALEWELDVNITAHVMSNSSLLAELDPPLTIDDWTAVVWNVSGGDLPALLYHANLGALQKAFSIILDIKRQPATLAFVVFKAVVRFLLEHLRQSLWSRVSTRYFTFCSNVLAEYPILGAVSVFEQNQKPRSHDEHIRHMFSEIKNVISRKIATVFLSEDRTKILGHLKNLKIMLPNQLFSLRLVIPNVTSDYVRNRIILFASGWGLHSFKPPPGVTARMSRAARISLITVIEDTVIIPIGAYSVLTFNESTEHVVSVPAIGVEIADAIWSAIVFRRAWSAETALLLANYNACKKNLTGLAVDRFTLLNQPLLSVDTALELVKGSNWLTRFEIVPPWKTSRCRLFYILLTHHYYCPANKMLREQLDKEVQYFASLSEDFRAAFGCARPKYPLPTCSLHRTSQK
ncbi:hypothetical protein V5799_003206 [Amblyomma americanum]|uniref:Uncharacterized protein n=1 Tax=Amblyomma americanum TaxID=6943 RepID=A0AAQ4D9L9_AMBAM